MANRQAITLASTGFVWAFCDSSGLDWVKTSKSGILSYFDTHAQLQVKLPTWTTLSFWTLLDSFFSTQRDPSMKFHQTSVLPRVSPANLWLSHGSVSVFDTCSLFLFLVVTTVFWRKRRWEKVFISPGTLFLWIPLTLPRAHVVPSSILQCQAFLSGFRRSAPCYCCCSVAKSRLTLCTPVNYSTPGFPVLHYLLVAQSHVHWISDAI